MPAVRHEDVQIRAFIDDREVATFAALDFSYDSNVQIESTKYQGQKQPFKDSTDNGWSFSFTTEIRDGFGDADDLIDAFLKEVNARSANGKVRLVFSYQVPGSAARRAYRLSNCQLNLGGRVASGGRLTKSVRGEAETREKIQ